MVAYSVHACQMLQTGSILEAHAVDDTIVSAPTHLDSQVYRKCYPW